MCDASGGWYVLQGVTILFRFHSMHCPFYIYIYINLNKNKISNLKYTVYHKVVHSRRAIYCQRPREDAARRFPADSCCVPS